MSLSPPRTEPIVLADRYELESMVGSGGMADVYRARDTLLGRMVAIKVFREAATDGTFDDRQRAEISLLARLNHPGLVTIFDAGSGVFPGGRHHAFLVMELVPGPSLADRLATGALPPVQAALVGAQVAESLGCIHAAGIVHRDVKPANILLPGADTAGTTEPWTKLTDFGIARLIEDARLTSTGLLVGTPGYLSPEQATGVSPGPPTDVYALGLVLLECLTGARVFPGTALESVAARLHHDPSVPAQVGPAWATLLTAMTARDPAARPTAPEAAGVLRGLAVAPDPAAAGTRPMPVTAAPAPVPTPRGPADATQILAALPAPTAPDPSSAAPDPAAPPSGPGSRGSATQILAAASLSAPPTPTAPDPASPGSGTSTAGRPDLQARAPGGPKRPAPGRRRFLVAVAVLAAVGLGVGIWLGGQRSAPAPGPAPSYPTVPGQLGTHLRGLEGSVAP